MNWRKTFEQRLGRGRENLAEGKRGDVWLERVCDEAGTPMSAVAVGPRDNGLWRVRSQQHGTQLVVSHAEARRVADALTGQSDGRVQRPMPQLGEPSRAAASTDAVASAGGDLEGRKTVRRRADAPGAARDSRRPLEPEPPAVPNDPTG